MGTEYPKHSSRESLLAAHSRIFDILSEIGWLGHNVHWRSKDSTHVAKLINAAVSTAIDVGPLTQAVNWFEAGRALAWSRLGASS